MLRVLRELGVDPAALLGHGGEACVFAYGDEQIVRVHHAEANVAAIEARSAVLGELRPHHSRLPFAIPHVCELQVIAERIVTLEPRFAGQTLARALRAHEPPVVARIEHETVLLDPRTVDRRDDRLVVEALRAALS